MVDDGNESSDAYWSSDEEDLSYVDFHTEFDDNVVIKTVTTNDPFLNKLCGENAMFINLVDEPVNVNDESVVNRTPVLKPPEYGTYASARGRGRMSRGGRGGFGGRGEGTVTMGEGNVTIGATRSSQRGSGKGPRGRGKGQKIRGKG
uniref:Calcium/proton exchanger n=1 Tax=Tanacetum cinerariifolium TaxID=118510 RepID=A0A699JW17_TANCI|nr:calcium/proton exchanger [Tanacetum cinerariifolium]